MKQNKTYDLTPKQAKFASLYVELSDASAAYRKSYVCDRMKPETIHRNAKALIDNNKVATRIHQIREKLEESRILSKEDIIEDLKLIASVSIKDYIKSIDMNTEKIVWINPNDWTPAMRRACTGIKNGRNGIELTVSGQEYAYNRIAKMMGYDAPIKTIAAESSLADLLK